MAKLTKDTALVSATAFCQAIPAGAAVKVVTSDRGLSITIDPAGEQHQSDAQVAIASLFANLPDSAILGVTKDSIGLGIGIIDVPAQPTTNTISEVISE